mmetsp:Transcript_15892/g.34399  ORF Transcript_15892/g.34399 Transcript_15892/m.34399 type:complete len:141 (+) Transcript_15892:111-533(+)
MQPKDEHVDVVSRRVKSDGQVRRTGGGASLSNQLLEQRFGVLDRQVQKQNSTFDALPLDTSVKAARRAHSCSAVDDCERRPDLKEAVLGYNVACSRLREIRTRVRDRRRQQKSSISASEAPVKVAIGVSPLTENEEEGCM